MKRKVLLSGMFVAAVLCGCTDDAIDNGNKIVDNPVKEGSEILFGSSLSGDADEEASVQGKVGTRTVYGERTSTGVPVYWKPEGDEVAIFCLQTSQPADHLVNYLVKPQEGEGNQHLSASVERLEEVGLQWGADDEHRFYAFYPASAVKGSDEEDQTGKITANIPVTQQPTSWEEGELNGVKTYFGLPNMDYAYMYAYTSQKKSETPEGTAIDLQFKNLVTVLDITVQGPESGEPITVSNINVTAVDGKNIILTGDFTCNIRGAQDNSDEVTAECEAAGNLQEVRNNVSIPCYNRQTDEFIKLGPNEQLNVKAYIIPDDDESHTIKPRQLQITVATLNGAAKRKVLQTADVVPHKINRVLLPHLEAGGTNYWMSNLNPRIYVTELSWPGSKMSLLTQENNADIVYQSTTIDQQLNDGVRAFIFQTQRERNGTLYLTANGNRINTTLSQGLRQIASFLDTAEQNGKRESAFVLVTYNSGEGSQNDWMRSLQSTINDCASDPQYRIFDGTLSPNTTLGDVANQIIVKCNYNDDEMISGVGTAPMLYTQWLVPYVEGGLPMTWSNPNGGKSFTWLYQEVTSVLDADRNENSSASAESTEAQKRQYIQTIFEESVSAYKNNNAHDIWFMNDLGGYYYYQTEITGIFGVHLGWEEHFDPTGLASDMNQLGVQLLQERTENAGLGLVYMNFANRNDDGQSYRSDWLIQTVIDNNFKFQLRMDAAESSQTYNASYSKGGNAIGWD
jgi:hypothetical protein